MIWDFIQNQILGMKWLNGLVQNLLTLWGIDVTSRLGGSISFFIYDVIKISILLFVLVFIISYVQSYFPPEKSKKIMGRFKGLGARIIGASWNCNSILQLFFHSAFYGLYNCGTSSGGYLQFFDFFSYGGFGKSCAFD